MKISFDFDCTLGETIIQKLAATILNSSVDKEIFIVTARNAGESYNQDLYRVAHRLGIRQDHIHFTEGGWKWKKIKELEIDIHFDDVPEECELILLHTKCLPLLLWDMISKDSIKHDSFGQGIY